MARIYRTSDIIKYKIGELEIHISPLDVHSKATLHQFLTKAQSGDVNSLMQGSAEALKMAVKNVKGLENQDGSEYKLEFESDKKSLTNECVSELMNLSESNEMVALCAQFISGVPNSSALPKGVSLVGENNDPNEKPQS